MSTLEVPLYALLALSVAVAADPKIVGGEIEAGFPGVVSIGGELLDERFSICTASVITPRLLLTAAHCGEDLPESLVASLGRAYVGESIADPDHVLALAGMDLHPDYVALNSDPTNPQGRFDLAVVELAEDSPVPWIALHLDPVEEDDVGREMLSVGYGLSNAAAQTGSGTKRSATLLLDDYDDQFLYTNGVRNDNNANICSGDSGGPQLLQRDDGTWEQWAVHSWGVAGCVGRSASNRVDGAEEWLLDIVEEVHGTRDWCEARGQYGDGVCDAECGLDPDCVPPFVPPGTEGTGGCRTPVPLSLWTLPPVLLLLGVRRGRQPDHPPECSRA